MPELADTQVTPWAWHCGEIPPRQNLFKLLLAFVGIHLLFLLILHALHPLERPASA